MKKILFTSFVIFFSVTFHYVTAQDTLKEGKITMAISFPDAGNQSEMMKSVMGSEQVIYFKNGNSRTEMKMMMGSVITIYNKQKNETYSLMDMMGTKSATKTPPNAADSLRKVMKMKKPKVKYTKETKMVLGYNCKKAIVTMEVKGMKQVMDYWYTDDIYVPSVDVSQINPAGKPEGITGFPVESTIKVETMTMKMSLSSIDKSPVPDSLFEIPADYPIKSMEELKVEVMSGMKKNMPGIMEENSPMDKTVTGDFPDIEMNNPDGKPLKLSSLTGKYVLVDFWASWCGPCRVENPNLVQAYKNYKDKGFTIYSVSLDSDKDKWLKAIEKDKLSWENHVCDFMGWDSPIVNQLNIQGIPASYLLDKEGKILATDLRGEEFEKKLKEVIK